MPRLMIEFSLAVALTLAAILSSTAGVSASDVMVSEAYARASATPAAKTAAVYVTLMNHAAEPDRVLSVATPAALSASIHATVRDGDVVRMVPAGELEIAPHGTVAMAPGGLHVMLTGLKAPLRQGGSLTLTFTFEKAGEMTVRVPVGGIAEDSHDHGSMGSGG